MAPQTQQPPGLQYPANYGPDPLLRGILKNIFDNLFYLRGATMNVTTPPVPAFKSVIGANGMFRIQLMPPDSPIGVVLYQILTASDAAFTMNVSYYGPDAAAYWEITDPDVTKYVGVRAKFSASDYSSLVVWSG